MVECESRIEDLQDAKDELVKLSCLPCSAIIVGLGEGDFDYLEEELGDTLLRDRQGRMITREFVQCVRYNNFR